MPTEKRYPFQKGFEAELAYAVAVAPKVFGALGGSLVADLMPTEAARLIVAAAQAVAADHGQPPTSTVVVLQRVRRQVDEGKVSHERLAEVDALFRLGEDLGALDDLDALVAEAAPVVRRLASQEAVEATISDFGKGLDPSKAAERFERVASIGQLRLVQSERLPTAQADLVRAVAQATGERLPVGVPELDVELRGGLERGAIGMVMGVTGTGKSLFLTHLTTQALVDGRDVAYVSLELSVRAVQSRVYRNLTNMTADEIASDPAEAERRMLHFVGPLKLGRLRCAYMTAQATTPADVSNWLRAEERDADSGGWRPSVIVVDMVDHLVSRVGSDKRSYEEMRLVMTSLRSLAIERDGWAFTASHVKTGNAGKKRIDVDQAADSANKSRIADLIVAISQTTEDADSEQLRFSIPKRREDARGRVVGPLPSDAARGRVVAVSRCVPWG